MGKGTFTISCPIGSYIDHKSALFGIINQDITEKKVCTQSAVDQNMGNNKNCSSFLMQSEMRDRLEQKCSGFKESCTISTKDLTKPPQDPEGTCGNDAFIFV